MFKLYRFSCVVVIMEERGLTLSQMSENFEQVGGKGGIIVKDSGFLVIWMVGLLYTHVAHTRSLLL